MLSPRRNAVCISAFHTAHLSLSRVWLCCHSYSQSLSTQTERSSQYWAATAHLAPVRKFFCDVPTCPRKIFAERLTSFVAPWARVIARLLQMVQIRRTHPKEPSSLQLLCSPGKRPSFSFLGLKNWTVHSLAQLRKHKSKPNKKTL